MSFFYCPNLFLAPHTDPSCLSAIPVTRRKSMEEAMGYSLSLPKVHCCIIAAENPEQLEFNVALARNYTPLNTAQMTQIEQLTANAGEDSAFFRQWT